MTPLAILGYWVLAVYVLAGVWVACLEAVRFHRRGMARLRADHEDDVRWP